MTTKNQSYRLLMLALCEDRIYEDTRIDFTDICRELKLSPIEMDELLVRELGVNGEELLEWYRKQN